MTVRAYQLVDTAPGSEISILETKLSAIKGTRMVDAVTGPYDIIAVVGAPDLNAVGDLVTTHIHTIGGIVRTVTCLTVGAS